MFAGLPLEALCTVSDVADEKRPSVAGGQQLSLSKDLL
jgi:hypothetical protein